MNHTQMRYELCVVINSQSVLKRAITDLRKEECPPAEMTKRFPAMVAHIKSMTASTPSLRPSAASLLRYGFRIYNFPFVLLLISRTTLTTYQLHNIKENGKLASLDTSCM